MSRRKASIIAAAAASVSTHFAIATPVIDGTLDAEYGAHYAEQTVQTGFGNNNSELDAGYLKIENGKLYLMLTGNLESNFNKLVIFFDTRAGGQNVMRNDNPDVDFNNLSTKYAGMTFDAGFSPDYTLFWSRDAGATYLNFAELNTNGGGLGGYLGSVATPNPGQQGSGTVGGGNLPNVEFGYNDSNTGGVGGGAPAAALAGEGASVTTGNEISIELPAIGATENFTMMIGVNGSSHDYWSNQFLPGATAPQGNLGGDGIGGFNGTVGGVNFDTMLPGLQYSTVTYHAALSEWNDSSSNWNNPSNWTGDGVPNAIDARAVLSSLGGAGPKTIDLDVDVKVASLTFSNANYTLSSTSGKTLAISGNPAVPSVQVLSGDHSITLPVTLATTTNFQIAAGSTMDVTGVITSPTVTVVKSGAGSMQVPHLRADGISTIGGVLKIADNGTDTGANRANFISIDGGPATPTATFDLGDNDLIVGGGTSITDVVGYLSFARNGGPWDMPGLSSSAAANHATGSTTLGVLTGQEYSDTTGNTTFSGLAYAVTDTLVKYTWYGDTDFNGVVDFDDYVRIDGGFNGGLSGWLNGDFDYNATIDFDDYVLIDNAFNTQNGTLIDALNWLEGEDRSEAKASLPGVSIVIDHFNEFGMEYVSAFYASVPEPTALGLIGLAATGAMRRRRRA